MKKVFAFVLVFILAVSVVLSGCDFQNDKNESTSLDAQTGKIELSAEKEQKIKEKFDDRITHSEFKGVVYAVYDDEVVYEKGVGKANKKENIDNDINTVFKIASNSKQFTATAIMMLQEQDKLSVNDTIDKYFPDYEYGKSITIHHLLCMRSGIIDFANNNEEINEGYVDDEILFDILPDNSPKENRKIIEEWFMSQPLRFTPDEKFEYSSSGYMLLGEIIEQVSGMAYEDFIQKNIFDPLEMTSSGFVDTYDKETDNIAKPYNKELNCEWLNYPGTCFANADIMSNALDLTKWVKGLNESKVINRDSFCSMTNDYSNVADRVSYGYGFVVEPDWNLVHHNGHAPSLYSSISFSLNYGYVQVLLSNYAYENIVQLSEYMNVDFYNALFDVE